MQFLQAAPTDIHAAHVTLANPFKHEWRKIQADAWTVWMEILYKARL